MDIKQEAQKIIDNIKKDPKMMEKFKQDPVQAIKDMGIDLPQDVVDKVIGVVKTANLDVNDLADKAKGLLGGLMK